jgi:hypothetical protein
MTQQALEIDADKKQVRAAKTIVASVITVVKMYSVYPVDHPNRERTVTGFHSNLSSFLEEYGNLGFEVAKEAFVVGGEPIQARTGDEENLAFSLFRDGIRWLEFVEGIEFWEIKTFFEILDRYKTLAEEGEDDLTSALWETQLPHLHYETTESLSDEDFEAESSKEDGANQIGGRVGQRYHMQSLQKTNIQDNVPGIPPPNQGAAQVFRIDPQATELTAREVVTLQEMVDHEERQDPTQRVLDMFSDILLGQEDKEVFRLILDFITKELKESFIEARFDIAIKILEGTRYIRGLCGAEKAWEAQQLDRFLSLVASSEFLGILNEKMSDTHGPLLEQIEDVLLLLPPEAIKVLTPMLLEATDFTPRRILTKAIARMASENLEPLEKLLTRSEPDTLEILIGILGKLEGQRPNHVLVQMTRHEAEQVRKAALKSLIKRRVWNPEAFFAMIEDESDSIKEMALGHLGSQRCQTAERLFVEHLKAGKMPRREKDHVLKCFKVLGVCGSDNSVPFLEEVLLGGSPIARLLVSPARKGAVAALHLLGTEEAERVLKRAVRSHYPGVRRALRAA